MNWEKKGLVFDINIQRKNIIVSHASIPFALNIHQNFYRIYFSSRNAKGQSLPYYVDALISDGSIKIQNDIVGPLLNLGALGTFDDSGIMPSCLVRYNRKVYMYYIGWNPQVSVSYRLSIGLAISNNEGLSFTRYSEAPICDRSLSEPFFNTAPYIIRENSRWRMWYISCTKWEIINSHPEPSYHVKYAESMDGIRWDKQGVVCINYDERARAIGRPCIIKTGAGYEMFFSYRDILNYRKSPLHGYKIGHATSKNGISWKKNYDGVGIALSGEGWDSVMMEYCHVFEHNGFWYMLYNGNDFGKDGFGYAIRRC